MLCQRKKRKIYKDIKSRTFGSEKGADKTEHTINNVRMILKSNIIKIVFTK